MQPSRQFGIKIYGRCGEHWDVQDMNYRTRGDGFDPLDRRNETYLPLTFAITAATNSRQRQHGRFPI
jgi:hypothetical protein